MVHVKIVSSSSNLNFEGEWLKNDNPGAILDELNKKAREKGIPVMVTIEHYGTFSITPHGQVMRGLLYDIDKLKSQNNTRKNRKR